MKKLFFTALVAVVAIGGAFAGSGKTLNVNAGVLNSTACDTSVDCSPEPITPCRIDQSDSGSPQAYLIDNQLPVGKCTQYLGYNN